MSHIKSLINNFINGRTDEAGLDLHTHMKGALQVALKGPQTVKEEFEGNNGEAFFEAITKVAGFEAEVQDVDEGHAEAYVIGDDGDHYRMVVSGEGLDDTGTATITHVSVEAYPGDARTRPTTERFKLTFNGGDAKSVEDAASHVWGKVGHAVI
jgi:hypothetical protein